MARPVEVMGKYVMYMEASSVTGEGTSSICRKGSTIEGKRPVAIKTYKQKSRVSEERINMTKFRRQISVLKMLQEPLVCPQDTTLWCDALASAKPAKLFMQLIDYSQDENGTPARCAADNVMYVVTELASYSLKDYIKFRNDQGGALSKESVHDVVKGIVLVTAGLHAKGLVHLDLKPENLMLFSGVLKLIDVDGCVKIGETISVNDSSLSFSPCYCAPEWAAFLIEDADEPTLRVDSLLDVWSIGMTICEVVALEPTLKSTYASFMRHGRSPREAGYFFLEWLATMKRVPLPKCVGALDKQLEDLLLTCLLVPDSGKRATLAQSLSHRYICNRDLHRSATGPITAAGADVSAEEDKIQKHKVNRSRVEDDSDTIHFQGKLYKLSSDADRADLQSWLLRDVWISGKGSLCYYSQKDRKRLVLLDGHQVHDAKFDRVEDTVRGPTFEMRTVDAEDQDKHIVMVFACETAEELEKWKHHLDQLRLRVMQSMHLGSNFASDFRKFRLTVKNRRLKPSTDAPSQFHPIFKSKLWKVKTDGDRRKAADWFQREMWLTVNGSLVYYSEKEGRDLVYFTAEDILNAEVSKLDAGDSDKPFTFQVHLPPQGDIEFSPGEFAAESEELREQWLEELAHFARGRASS